MAIHHPPLPGFRTQSFQLLRAGGSVEAPFSLRRQVFEWPAEKLGCSIDMPPMTRDSGQAWEAFFADLGHGSVWISPSVFLTDTTPLGTPCSMGTASGSTIKTKDWMPDARIRAGLWVAIGGRLRRVVRDSRAEKDGDATIEVWPRIGRVSNETPIVWQSPRGRFVLSGDPPNMVWRVDKFLDGFSFSLVEEDHSTS